MLHHPEQGDTRGCPYVRRRAPLEHLPVGYGIAPPIQAVPTTTDVDLTRV
ncbi:hypothetical protein QQM39_17780 [Streptomyces sp. DT2A-34]|nr:hypothetical protein [Streptomyces sp. DT2A-34]MDO0912629.1 hypothetical protein [Streptomyces sp. DT2A-34]